jgi:hypothetical protein
MSGEISGFIANAKIINDEVRETFGKLTKEQLNMKPSSVEWSIAQCFDHLNTTNELYFAKMQKVADGTHVNNWFSAIPFIPNTVGNLLKKAVSPDAQKKQKAPTIFAPSESDISETVIEDFCKDQEKFIAYMDAAKTLDTSKIKIPSPISDAVNLWFNDACEIIILHNRRHFNQAKRVLEFVENLR